MITNKQAESALDYLCSTDSQIAQAKGQLLAAEYMVKKAEAMVFLESTGNIEERKSKARTDLGVLEAVEAYKDATYDYHRIDAARKTKMLVIEVWRSQESSRRAGNV